MNKVTGSRVTTESSEIDDADLGGVVGGLRTVEWTPESGGGGQPNVGYAGGVIEAKPASSASSQSNPVKDSSNEASPKNPGSGLADFFKKLPTGAGGEAPQKSPAPTPEMRSALSAFFKR